VYLWGIRLAQSNKKAHIWLENKEVAAAVRMEGENMNLRKNASFTRERGKPFAKGNSGRPVGALNKATVAVQTILDGEAEALTRTAIELALGGNLPALKLCLDRICPPRKERPLDLPMPEVVEVSELPKLTSALLAAVGNGQMESGQAASLSILVANHAKALELVELERRISALEGKK
jgi:hypothetical protein